MNDAQALAPIPAPGADLVPDGWAESVVVPWLAEQVDAAAFQVSSAQLAGLEAAYKTMNADTLELTKARRYLEVRWGELLGPAKPGPQSSPASDDFLPRMDRHRLRQLAAPEARERVRAKIAGATEAEEITRRQLLATATGAHVNQTGGEFEWYTPAPYLEAARRTMGAIDLDPASTEAANAVVQATHYYTVEDDGLAQPWVGRVWLNAPYAVGVMTLWMRRLVESYRAGDVTEAIAIMNNATETAWCQSVAEIASAVCLLRARVRFWHPEDGRSESTPLQGQVIFYLGSSPDAFVREFATLGVARVWRP